MECAVTLNAVKLLHSTPVLQGAECSMSYPSAVFCIAIQFLVFSLYYPSFFHFCYDFSVNKSQAQRFPVIKAASMGFW